MIVKLLGLIDLLAAIFIILLKFHIGESIALIFAILLIIKSILFLSSSFFVSSIDILSGIFLILAAYGNYYFFTWIFALWLLQKAFFSLSA